MWLTNYALQIGCCSAGPQLKQLSDFRNCNNKKNHSRLHYIDNKYVSSVKTWFHVAHMWEQLEVPKHSSTFPHKLSHINKPGYVYEHCNHAPASNPFLLSFYLLPSVFASTFYKLSPSPYSACKIRLLIDVWLAAKPLSNLLIHTGR